MSKRCPLGRTKRLLSEYVVVFPPFTILAIRTHISNASCSGVKTTSTHKGTIRCNPSAGAPRISSCYLHPSYNIINASLFCHHYFFPLKVHGMKKKKTNLEWPNLVSLNVIFHGMSKTIEFVFLTPHISVWNTWHSIG